MPDATEFFRPEVPMSKYEVLDHEMVPEHILLVVAEENVDRKSVV